MKLEGNFSQTGQYDVACLIIGRNLGDAVIQSQFFHKLIQRRFAKRYIVWTRPQVAFLFENLPESTVVTSPFPVGTIKQFDFKALRQFLIAVNALRKIRPMVTLDLIGDFRERVFAKLIGTTQHLHIGWAVDHPFNLIIRNPLGNGRPSCVVPQSIPSVYQAYDLFLNSLTPFNKYSIPDTDAILQPAREIRKRIGLHPFASQACRLWPSEKWRDLARRLIEMEMDIDVYSAPGEQERLHAIFDCLPHELYFFSKSLPEFAQRVSKLNLLIGLDSFSVHIAEKYHIPSVTIFGASHPALWLPPHSIPISSSGGCVSYPCMNKPICERTSTKYACITSVEVIDVLRSAMTALSLRSTL